MSCIVPPVHPNPFLYNYVIDKIQSDLATLCPWIEQIFPLVVKGETEIDGNRILVPMVFAQDGTKNYINLFPNGGIKAGSFFHLPDAEMIINQRDDEQEVTIDLICWGNLYKIANRTYDYTDELTASAINALRNGTYGSDIVEYRILTERDEIFSPWGYSFEQLKQFSFPYFAFKIRFTLLLDNDIDCFTAGSFDPSFSPTC